MSAYSVGYTIKAVKKASNEALLECWGWLDGANIPPESNNGILKTLIINELQARNIFRVGQ